MTTVNASEKSASTQKTAAAAVLCEVVRQPTRSAVANYTAARPGAGAVLEKHAVTHAERRQFARVLSKMRRLSDLLLIAHRYAFMNVNVLRQRRQIGQTTGATKKELKRTVSVSARRMHVTGKRRCRVFINLYASSEDEFCRFHSGLCMAV